jgi:short chain dehydrogenase
MVPASRPNTPRNGAIAQISLGVTHRLHHKRVRADAVHDSTSPSLTRPRSERQRHSQTIIGPVRGRPRLTRRTCRYDHLPGHEIGVGRIVGFALFAPGMRGMDLGLQNRVYLVTGGSRGLGFAAAEALIAEGARIVLSSPRQTAASAAAARLAHNAPAGSDMTWVAADNSDPATPDRLIEAARERFSRLDGALISAGGTLPGTISSTTDEQ